MARDHDRLLAAFSALLAPLASAACGPAIAVDDSGDESGDEASATGDGTDDGMSGDGGSDDGTIDPEQFDTDLCDETDSQILAAVAPAEPFDYAELRWAERLDWGEEIEWSEPYVREQVGARCGGAADPAACEEAWAGLPLESAWMEGGFDGVGFRSVAFTRGDLAQAILDRAGLDAFLGALDTPADAALLAVLEGHRLACTTGPEAGVSDDGFILHTTSGGGCGEGDDIEEHVILVRPDGTIEVLQTVLIEKGDPGCAAGRMPAGWCRRRRSVAPAKGPVGAFFADVAALEAASVAAFGQLASELSVHGAPRAFVRAAARSAREEVMHARITARLARRHGGRVVGPRVAACDPRPLVEVVADNAAEGCIRETYGALVAHRQARHATDPVVRRVLGRIARDETRHAALSWRIARWADARLASSERAEVRRRARRALDELEVELTREVDDRVHEVAGLPHADEARRLYRGLRDALWT